jgi:hypothetical protein
MTVPPPRIPCTCPPRTDGYHGIVLHAYQVDDLVDLLTTLENWLLSATDEVHDDLRDFLTTPPDPVQRIIKDLGATAMIIIRSGRESQLAWTPC